VYPAECYGRQSAMTSAINSSVNGPVQSPLEAVLAGKKHIIWDWNGTILDDVSYAVETINWQLARHDRPQLSLAEYRAIFDFPIRQYYDRLGFDYERASFETLCHEYVEQYMSGYQICRPFEPVLGVLRASRSQCEHQSILSASEQSSLEQMIAHFAIGDLFDHIYGIDNRFAASKLDSGRRLIETSGVGCEDTVMVGDTLHDVEVARALGIDIVLVDHGHHAREKLLGADVKVVSV